MTGWSIMVTLTDLVAVGMGLAIMTTLGCSVASIIATLVMLGMG